MSLNLTWFEDFNSPSTYLYILNWEKNLYESLSCKHMIHNMNRDSSVGIVTGLDGRGLILGRVKRFFSTPQDPDRLRSPDSLSIQWVHVAPSPGLKRQGRKTDHSPSSSTEVKNGEAIPLLYSTSSWPYCLI
jgi:hypothetical protein